MTWSPAEEAADDARRAAKEKAAYASNPDKDQDLAKAHHGMSKKEFEAIQANIAHAEREREKQLAAELKLRGLK